MENIRHLIDKTTSLKKTIPQYYATRLVEKDTTELRISKLNKEYRFNGTFIEIIFPTLEEDRTEYNQTIDKYKVGNIKCYMS